ncbi:iron ABC transporter permease [Pseudoxanthomonas sp. PXM02]|uniref:ABC transporter permease n=1 Tax=Pseudoxanthomonas sp. PXM02 TaxID=2769294 RepID=UPI00177DC8D0|nr:iron ABC transporter permease [Pseudoxanthomonas sp. PXM02]MBD9477889.1 iron ABC transporter permease [Pseudoxanthomonas sp. PXM02]
MRTARRLPAGWRIAAAGIGLAAVAPLIALVVEAAGGSGGLWAHLARHVLPQAGVNTLLLLAGVGVIVGVVGTGTAWLVTAYAFPGRRVMAWALLLPLAVPTYVVAYVYLDLLHPLGPLHGGLRAVLGIDDPRDLRLPDARSLVGCIVLLGFVLYPYVYLTTRAMFMTQAGGLLDAARSLGTPASSLFHRVALPLARPAIAVGMVLALLEALNDIGASEFLGVQTLTVSVYTTWIARGDLAGAAQIALGMLAVVLALLALERYARRRQRYATARRPQPMQPTRLRGIGAFAAFVATLLPVTIGFLLPFAHLAMSGWQRWRQAGLSPQLLDSLWNTLKVAVLATALTLVAALVVVWALRLARARRHSRVEAISLRSASLGYAIPGTVLALGLLAPMGAFDAGLSALLAPFDVRPQLWLMGSAAALVIAYTLRFLTIAIGNLEAGMERIAPSLDDAARSLGETPAAVLRRVHLPLLRPALAAGALLVFVDVMKELPATLLLRPLGFDTLATWLYADAARGAYEEGAIAALLIVVAGLLPVVLLARAGHRMGRCAA